MKNILIASLILIISSCHLINESGGEVEFDLNLSDSKIDRLEEFQATYKITNNSDEEIIYFFGTGCKFGYTIKKGDQVIFDAANFQVCTQATSTLKIMPNEFFLAPITLNVALEHADFESGKYSLDAFLLTNEKTSVRKNFILK